MDESGRIFALGTFTGTVDLGGGDIRSTPTFRGNPYALALSAAGAHSWSRGLVVAGKTELWTMAYGNGSLLLGGDGRDEIDYGGGPLFGAGWNDLYPIVAKFDSSDGSYIWAQAGAWGGSAVRSVAMTDSGEGVLVGAFGSGSAAEPIVEFGGGVLWTAGETDIFVVRVGP